MSDDLSAIADLARRFFDAIEAGDVAAVSACYAEDIAVWHNTDGVAQTKAENLRVLTGFTTHFADITYSDRRLGVFPGGFTHQHRLTATRRDGVALELPACIVCAVSGGRITRLDEYFDSAHEARFRGG